jgi:isochorismate pyruvate lyase
MGLQNIRKQIDDIDHFIIKLLQQRKALVVSAASFKRTKEGENGVIVPSRIESMMMERKRWAREFGLDEEFVEELFSKIINYMIELEMKRWESLDGKYI